MYKMPPISSEKELLRQHEYYMKNSKVKNTKRYVNYLNQKGKEPSYNAMIALELFIDEEGKWAIPEDVLERLRDVPVKRRGAKAAEA